MMSILMFIPFLIIMAVLIALVFGCVYCIKEAVAKKSAQWTASTEVHELSAKSVRQQSVPLLESKTEMSRFFTPA